MTDCKLLQTDSQIYRETKPTVMKMIAALTLSAPAKSAQLLLNQTLVLLYCSV